MRCCLLFINRINPYSLLIPKSGKQIISGKCFKPYKIRNNRTFAVSLLSAIERNTHQKYCHLSNKKWNSADSICLKNSEASSSSTNIEAETVSKKRYVKKLLNF